MPFMVSGEELQLYGLDTCDKTTYHHLLHLVADGATRHFLQVFES